MNNCGIIGKGKWGTILKSKLEKIANVNFFVGKKAYSNKLLDDVNWVFIATPDNTHYKLVLNCLDLGKNVFCEKPLTLSHQKSKFLFNKAKKLKLKLYVDDVEIYKKKKIILKKGINNVERSKRGNGSNKSLLNRLVYHDLYLLYSCLKKKKLKKIINIRSNNKINFKLLYKNFHINFLYSINNQKKIHKINNVDLLKFKLDPLNSMLKKLLLSKVDFFHNRNSALFAQKIIDKLKLKIS